MGFDACVLALAADSGTLYSRQYTREGCTQDYNRWVTMSNPPDSPNKTTDAKESCDSYTCDGIGCAFAQLESRCELV